jgi:hypothetical protein
LTVAKPRVVERDEIDDALDGVVMTVDDLVRDLETEALEFRRRAYLSAPPGEPAPRHDRPAASLLRSRASGRSRVRNAALMAVVLLLVVVIEFLVLEWIISRP